MSGEKQIQLSVCHGYKVNDMTEALQACKKNPAVFKCEKTGEEGQGESSIIF